MRLPGKRHEGGMWDAGNTLYLDWGRDYSGGYIY